MMNLLYSMSFFLFFFDIVIEITSLLILIYYYIFAKFYRISIKYIGNTHKTHTQKEYSNKKFQDVWKTIQKFYLEIIL